MSNLEQIKKLRELTGAGMMECKNSLDESGGDIDKAIEVLRKKGALKAAKKAQREAKEGSVDIAISSDHKNGSIVQVNCETDFVARNPGFVSFVKELAEAGLRNGAREEFEKKKDDLVLKLGENITFGNAEVLTGGYVAGYLHSNKKVASLVVFNKEVNEEIAHEVAMQIVAASPVYIKCEDVPAEVLEHEKEIYREQLKNEGKPENMIEKILFGKLAKFYEEVCLLKQPFIKEEKKRVEQLLPEGAEVTKFVRFFL